MTIETDADIIQLITLLQRSNGLLIAFHNKAIGKLVTRVEEAKYKSPKDDAIRQIAHHLRVGLYNCLCRKLEESQLTELEKMQIILSLVSEALNRLSVSEKQDDL